MKHDSKWYEARANEADDIAETIADNSKRPNNGIEALLWATRSNTFATLAVAAATLEAARTVYPANHPLAQETT